MKEPMSLRAQRSNLFDIVVTLRGCRVGLRPPRNDVGFSRLCERSADKLASYEQDMSEKGFRVSTTTDADDIMASCKLIVTTTPATRPILTGQAQPGTHITAVGSDTHDKQELDAEILSRAELVVADSILQCLERGEIHQALKCGAISEDSLVELGSIIAGDATGRESDDQITIADLTGVAVQDIQISKAVIGAE